MLGRTDSRRRLLFLLVVFVVGAVRARRRASPTGRSSSATGSPREALAQTTVTLDDAEQARRHLRPDRDGRPGHDRRARAARRGAVDQLTPEQREATVADADPDPRPRPRPPRSTLRDTLSGSAKYVILAPRPRPRRRRPDPGRDRGQARRRACRSSRSPSGSTRRPAAGPNSTLAAQLLGFVNREGDGQYGVEQDYQATLAGQPRVVVAERDASGRPCSDAATVVRGRASPARTSA